MQDRFDKELADRIKQVFDTYEDDSADHGWEQLREKFPAKKERSTLIYWLTSAAAAFILIAGAWLFIPQNENTQKLTSEPTHNEVRRSSKDTSSVNRGDNALQETELVAKQVPENTEENTLVALPGSARAIIKDTAVSTYPALQHHNNIAVTSKLIANNIASEGNDPSEINISDSIAHKISPVIAEKKNVSFATTQNETPKAKTTLGTEQPGSYLELEREKRALVTKRTDDENRERQKNKLSFSLFAGSFVSYAEGSKSSMNSGVGVTSEFGITSKLKITTGVSIAQNTLKYDKKLPEQAASMFLASSMSTSQDLMVAGPEAKTSAINYSINGYDASLLGLDVPINLKYTFVEKKNELYVVAGLSSNFFFDESYTYAYEYNSLIDNSFESSPDKTTTSTSSTFDFARMLNFSIGYGYPVGKQSKLSVEPFLKYPLGGMGAQNLRFGSAGLNLKWSFTSR